MFLLKFYQCRCLTSFPSSTFLLSVPAHTYTPTFVAQASHGNWWVDESYPPISFSFLSFSSLYSFIYFHYHYESITLWRVLYHICPICWVIFVKADPLSYGKAFDTFHMNRSYCHTSGSSKVNNHNVKCGRWSMIPDLGKHLCEKYD